MEVEVRGPRTPVQLPSGADFYLVNDDDLTFATTRPVAGDKRAMLAAAPALPTAVSRGVAVATVWDMLLTGEATAAEAAHAYLAVLAVETSESVIEPYLSRAGDVAEQWAPDTERAELTAAVAATCRGLARQGHRRRVALRALARTAGGLDEVARLQAEAGDDVDLQWRALVRKAELGGDTADEVRRLLERDPDPDARFRALAVRAATPDADAKAAVWQALVEDRSVPIGSLHPVAAALWRPGQDEILAPYAERYVRLLPGLHRGGMTPAMAFTSRLFPRYGIDEPFLDRAEEAAGQAVPVVRKTLLERADLVRRMLRARGAGRR